MPGHFSASLTCKHKQFRDLPTALSVSIELPPVDLTVLPLTRPPRPSPSILAYCKQSDWRRNWPGNETNSYPCIYTLDNHDSQFGWFFQLFPITCNIWFHFFWPQIHLEYGSQSHWQFGYSHTRATNTVHTLSLVQAHHMTAHITLSDFPGMPAKGHISLG